MEERQKAYEESAAYLRSHCSEIPDTALILGSGLSGITSHMQSVQTIPYANIPHFPKPSVQSHTGTLYAGSLFGKNIFVFSGRSHYYEGLSFAQTAYYVGVLHALGVQTLILTNAAGGIHPDYRLGELVLIADHIKLTAESPVRGENSEPRFFDMTNAYDWVLREKAKAAAERIGMFMQEGVYAFMAGPQYETPAEIRALERLGADLVGMSTVPEAILAAKFGMQTLALSMVTNQAAGISPQALSHEEVLEVTGASYETYCMLMKEILSNL